MKPLRIGSALLSLALLAGCDDPNSKPASGKNPAGNPAAAAANNSSLANAKKQATRTVDLVALNKAIEKFYVQEGRFPKKLTELVELDYVRDLPPPPAGKKLAYNSELGAVSLEPEDPPADTAPNNR